MHNGSLRAAVFLPHTHLFYADHPIKYGREFSPLQAKKHIFMFCLTKSLS